MAATLAIVVAVLATMAIGAMGWGVTGWLRAKHWEVISEELAAENEGLRVTNTNLLAGMHAREAYEADIDAADRLHGESDTDPAPDGPAF